MAQVQVATRFSATTGLQMVAGGARAGNLHKVRITAAALTVTCIIYDNADTATGTVLAILSATAGFPDETDYSDPGLSFQKGLWAVLTGAGANLLVTYE